MARRAPPPDTRRPESDDAAAREPVLSPELLARIHAIEIRTRRLTASMLGGEYRSIFRGSGIEFAEAREYIDGDDVRLIDWNVTARMGVPWVKEYVEERDLTVIAAVDRSPSMRAARPDRGRLTAAAELTALVALAATQSGDRAGLLTFGEGIDGFVTPRRGTRHALRLVRDVIAAEPHAEPAAGARTSIAGAADYLVHVLGRRSVIFLISDFFDTGYEQALRGLAQRHEVIALPLIDANDLALPDVGLVAVADAESGARLWVDTSDARVRQAYATAAEARAEYRRHAFAVAGVDEVSVAIEGDVVSPLAAYFRRRARTR